MRAEEQPHARVKGGIARMQFLREDETALVQVGPDMLSVNHLKPYPNWAQFKTLIFGTLAIYRQTINPESIKRIGLRYINKIEIPQPRVQIEDYILAIPSVPQPVPQTFASFILRVEIPFEQTNGMLILQTGTVPPEQQGNTAFLLDLDFITLQPQTITLESVTDWVEQAHEKVEETFEACITEKARAIFKEVSHNE